MGRLTHSAAQGQGHPQGSQLQIRSPENHFHPVQRKAWLHKKRSRIRMWPYKNIAV